LEEKVVFIAWNVEALRDALLREGLIWWIYKHLLGWLYNHVLYSHVLI